tara:strand:+ start:155 stop:586 length:432 start_codon:yes stop_codon:yes gene_type:complete
VVVAVVMDKIVVIIELVIMVVAVVELDHLTRHFQIEQQEQQVKDMMVVFQLNRDLVEVVEVEVLVLKALILQVVVCLLVILLVELDSQIVLQDHLSHMQRVVIAKELVDLHQLEQMVREKEALVDIVMDLPQQVRTVVMELLL